MISIVNIRKVRTETSLEQATGIEPAPYAWEAQILPLNYACILKL